MCARSLAVSAATANVTNRPSEWQAFLANDASRTREYGRTYSTHIILTNTNKTEFPHYRRCNETRRQRRRRRRRCQCANADANAKVSYKCALAFWRRLENAFFLCCCMRSCLCMFSWRISPPHYGDESNNSFSPRDSRQHCESMQCSALDIFNNVTCAVVIECLCEWLCVFLHGVCE